MPLERFASRHQLRLGDWNTRELHDVLGTLFVHRQRRRKNARMRVRDGEHFEDALHATVLAELAVQRVETDIGIYGFELAPEVSIDVDLGDAITLAAQRFTDSRAGVEAHLAFRRQPAHRTAT